MNYYKNKQYKMTSVYEFMHMPYKNNRYQFNAIFKNRNDMRNSYIMKPHIFSLKKFLNVNI